MELKGKMAEWARGATRHPIPEDLFDALYAYYASQVDPRALEDPVEAMAQFVVRVIDLAETIVAEDQLRSGAVGHA
jgi:hypothetical protein